MAKFGNSSSTEATDGETEWVIDEKSGETITANTEKKSHCYQEIRQAKHVKWTLTKWTLKLVIGVVARFYKIKK